MKVRELIEVLRTFDQEAPVRLSVGWAADSATSDEGDDPEVVQDDGCVFIRGWLSNCGTTLEIGEGD